MGAVCIKRGKDKQNTHTVLVGKFEVMTPFRIHWSKCKSNNINIP